jgi:hypothetical protein
VYKGLPTCVGIHRKGTTQEGEWYPITCVTELAREKMRLSANNGQSEMRLADMPPTLYESVGLFASSERLGSLAGRGQPSNCDLGMVFESSLESLVRHEHCVKELRRSRTCSACGRTSILIFMMLKCSNTPHHCRLYLGCQII